MSGAAKILSFCKNPFVNLLALTIFLRPFDAPARHAARLEFRRLGTVLNLIAAIAERARFNPDKFYFLTKASLWQALLIYF